MGSTSDTAIDIDRLDAWITDELTHATAILQLTITEGAVLLIGHEYDTAADFDQFVIDASGVYDRLVEDVKMLR